MTKIILIILVLSVFGVLGDSEKFLGEGNHIIEEFVK